VLCVILADATAAKEDESVNKLVKKLDSYGADTMAKRAAVGGVVGFVGGTMIRKTQDLVLTCGILGGAAVAGACYVGWIKPEDVNKAAETAADAVGAKSMFDSLFTTSVEDVVDLKKSKTAMSKIYKAAPGLVVGTALGFGVGYKIG